MELDARGKACPMPVVLAMKELEKCAPGEVLEVLVDNEAAVGNLQRMAAGKNASAAAEKRGADWCVSIMKNLPAADIQEGNAASAGSDPAAGAAASETAAAGEMCCAAPRQEKLVIAIGSACMGQGDDQLGGILMKSYLFSLTQQEKVPDTVLFFNGGVRLTTEGSASLEDIRELEKRGAEIFSCGTCLDFYGLKDKLQVGAVTNMYAIAEAMQTADRLVRI